MTEPDYKGFALAVMEDWPETGILDGIDLQEMAEKHGLLRPEELTEPCAENCQCSEYYGRDEMSEGVTCYRKVWVTESGEPGNDA